MADVREPLSGEYYELNATNWFINHTEDGYEYWANWFGAQPVTTKYSDTYPTHYTVGDTTYYVGSIRASLVEGFQDWAAIYRITSTYEEPITPVVVPNNVVPPTAPTGSLTNPISSQNIVDRFEAYFNLFNSDISTIAYQDIIVDTAPGSWTLLAQAGLSPDKTVPYQYVTTSGIEGADGKVNAWRLFSALRDQVNDYTKIRRMNLILRILGAGGNNGSRLTGSKAVSGRTYIEIWNMSGYVHYTSDLRRVGTSRLEDEGLTPSGVGLTSGTVIDDVVLQNFMYKCIIAYRTIREDVGVEITEICHASCHRSCHSNRGRR